MINNWNFLNDKISYSVSGSFVLYISKRFGVKTFKKLLIKENEDNFSNKFFNIHHMKMADLEYEWKTYVGMMCVEDLIKHIYKKERIRIESSISWGN